MKKTVFRYGFLAALVIVVLSAGSFLLTSKTLDYDTQEVIGYLTIFISMIFVFLGIKHFRDRINHNTLSFGEGLKVGILIVLIPSVFFGLFALLYTEVLNPSWGEQYYSHYIASIKDRLPAEEVAAAVKKVEKEKEMFANPGLQFILMFITVFTIGFIVSIISALSLRRRAVERE